MSRVYLPDRIGPKLLTFLRRKHSNKKVSAATESFLSPAMSSWQASSVMLTQGTDTYGQFPERLS